MNTPKNNKKEGNELSFTLRLQSLFDFRPSNFLLFKSWGLLCLLGASACASSAPPPQAGGTAELTQTQSAAELMAEEEEAMAAIAAAESEIDAEEAEAMAAIAAAESEIDAEEKQREVIYRISGDQLSIEIESATFIPKVTPIKLANGWGLRFEIEATTEAEMTIFAADAGPLAFAAWVITDGMREKYFDQRRGGTVLAFSPGTTLNFSRTWPSGGLEPILPNRDVEINVGLWGIGSEDKPRRVLPKFCTIRMKVRAEGVSAEVLPPQ